MQTVTFFIASCLSISLDLIMIQVNRIATTFTLNNHTFLRGHLDSDHFVLFDI